MDQSELEHFLNRAGYGLLALEQLQGDVSPRRYARLTLDSGATAIAALYPSELRDACKRFQSTTVLLELAGVRVPRVLGADCDGGVMLLEDLGAETLFDRVCEGVESLLPSFEQAIEGARRIAALDPAAVADLNPPLDGDLMSKELQQTIELYLLPNELLGADSALRARARLGLESLCSALGDSRPVPCHRDYMARNLVPHADGVAVLDHQDLRLGPPGYDLASLLNDSFFPAADTEARLLDVARLSGDEVTDYHRAALQRTLKAIGTFAAFARRGSDRHLPLIAPTLERARLHLSRVPETAEIRDELEPLWAHHRRELEAAARS